jgi:hypothetical protein
MQNVEAREGNAAGADFFHAGLILSAPGIAKASQSRAKPSGARLASACDATPPRQSTSVPKTSKKRAFISVARAKRGLV